MSHTYTDLLMHVVFSTHERRPAIADSIRPELHAYLGGIIRELHGTAVLVGGTRDHVHILMRLPGDVRVSDCVRILKTNSSRWVHEKWPMRKSFAWQAGYAAFSVSESARERVCRYVANQERHHGTMSFQNEFIALLKKHNVEYDERYLWG